jgi:hypothetical protein
MGGNMQSMSVCEVKKPKHWIVHPLPVLIVHPLPVLDGPWIDLNEDFVIGLSRRQLGNDSIFVGVDQVFFIKKHLASSIFYIKGSESWHFPFHNIR